MLYPIKKTWRFRQEQSDKLKRLSETKGITEQELIRHLIDKAR